MGVIIEQRAKTFISISNIFKKIISSGLSVVKIFIYFSIFFDMLAIFVLQLSKKLDYILNDELKIRKEISSLNVDLILCFLFLFIILFIEDYRKKNN